MKLKQNRIVNNCFLFVRKTIWNLRMERIETIVLSKWSKFTIWNAGKQGRKFYKSLSNENRKKVECFCDVDEKKIGKKYRPFDVTSRKATEEIEIVHFTEANPPFVICVKMVLFLNLTLL